MQAESPAGAAATIGGLSASDRPAAEIALPTLYAILRLRVDVFVVEQACAYPELDGRDLDPATRHVWLAPPGDPTDVASYLRVLADPEGGPQRIGRVVTAPTHRGRGLGGALLRWTRDRHPGSLVLDAQSHLQAFYEGLGFVVDGPGFVEDGIPHVPMRRDA